MAKTQKRNFLKNYLIILGLCLLAYAIRTVAETFEPRFNFVLFIVSIFLVSISWEFLYAVDQKLNKIYPYERSVPGRIALQISIGILFGIMVRYILYAWGEPYIPMRLDALFLAVTWILYVVINTAVNAIFFINYFVERWKEYLIKSERLEKEKSQVQFENLKNQLNPHFLFNALTSLNGLIFENQKLASDFLQQLSKVYRYVLQNNERESVSLHTEVEFIRNYIRLAETRFRGALKVNMQIDSRAHDQAIVPVTLQVLIENAIKHNIIDVEKPLTIDLVTEDGYIVVSNNLQVRKTVETSNKLGLERLRSLYNFLTDKPVIIDSSSGRFSVKIPLI